MIGKSRGLMVLALLLGTAPAMLGAQSRESRTATPDASDLDEDGQLAKLPALPSGMTLGLIRQGDSLYRGKGGCIACHGDEGGGMPASGSGITAGLHFVPSEWGPIDSVIRTGVPEPTARSPVAMPGRGAQSNLTDQETRAIAAYVWAISQVRGEPWPGGHQKH
jgi:mono/diheme cytochrome c family protein